MGMMVQIFFKMGVSFLPFIFKSCSLLTCFLTAVPCLHLGFSVGNFSSVKIELAKSRYRQQWGYVDSSVPLTNTPVAADALVPSSKTSILALDHFKNKSHLGLPIGDKDVNCLLYFLFIYLRFEYIFQECTILTSYSLTLLTV